MTRRLPHDILAIVDKLADLRFPVYFDADVAGYVPLLRREFGMWRDPENLRTQGRNIECCFRLACGSYDVDKRIGLAFCKWLVDAFHLTEERCNRYRWRALHNAVHGNHLEAAQWLDQMFGITRSDVFASGALILRASEPTADPRFLQWLTRRFSLEKCDIMRFQLFAVALARGHVRKCRWMCREFGIVRRDVAGRGWPVFPALYLAAHENRRVACRWFIETFELDEQDIILSGAELLLA